MLQPLRKSQPLKVEYDLYVREEELKEIKIERFICPTCHFNIRKENYGCSECPTCKQKLRW